MLASAAQGVSNAASGAAKWALSKAIQCGPIPKHVAFIMDGNRRFARKTHSQLAEGHSAGEKKLQETLQWCLDLGIQEVTVFAFSIENFKRSEEEVHYLMDLAGKKVKELISHPDFRVRNRIRVYGDLRLLPSELQSSIAEAMHMSRNNPGAVLNICFSYTSTHEITHAVRKIAEGVQGGYLKPDDIDIDLIEQCLYTHGSAPIDLLIRTSGEIRLSDFLLWQSSTSCLAFLDVLWPEFSVWDLYKTLIQYQYNYSRMMQLRETLSNSKPSRTKDADSENRVAGFISETRSKEAAFMESLLPETRSES
eukprot:TRINITY_DN8251_c0_g1_i1.p1 TRINITY_DN8251_c0_g1~~TRINITY_DN8251_c0_g1_i1.p1  ORF type:complete len:308 (+),score=36.62 TRINITY_DN8251_c0_g1_i1:38-961(+)